MPKAGRLEINRFQHDEYPYAVFYTPEGDPLRPLGGSWQVDNFSVEAGTNRYVPKQGPEYASERSYDVDGNGTPEVVKREVFYDLLLDHAQKDATMWVRTVPVSAKDRDKDLKTLGERYVDSVARSGNVAVPFGAESPVGPSGKRFVSQTLHAEGCTVSKREAHRVDFEIADVDQANIAQAHWKRASVVLVRTGYGHRVENGNGGHTDYPVLMALGLSAKPEDFAALEGDFERLLKQTVLGDVGQGLSMNGETTCSLSREPATSGGEAAPEGAELNEAAQVPLAPEALPEGAPSSAL